MRIPAAGLAAALLIWIIAPHIYDEFPGARVKVVRGPMPAAAARFEIPIGVRPTLARLQPPFALIVRVRNDGSSPVMFTIELDGYARCSEEIAPGKSRRLDCAVRDNWIGDADHAAVIVGGDAPFTVEELELATHHGAISSGPKDLIVVPEGFSAYQPASVWQLGLVFLLMCSAVLSVWRPRSVYRRWLARSHLALTIIVVLILLTTVTASWFSPYALVISVSFLSKLLIVGAAPALWSYARVLWRWIAAPRIVPYSRAAAIGLFVGWVFTSFAGYRVDRWYGGNITGLLSIGTLFSEHNPLLNERPDLRASLHVVSHGGYDGQFFYFMAFDPLINRYANRRDSYHQIADDPPYRFGRIGFPWLTWLFSAGQPERFPATMVAIILGSLGLCAALLSLLAQRYGLSSLYGLIILMIPGFWESAVLTLPEPLTLVFVLGALLAAAGQRWFLTGLCLAMAMLIRETGGGIVLAIPAAIFLAGHRRAAVLIAVMAFAPIVMWKLYLGWAFYPLRGMAAFTPHPDDVGVPFKGVFTLFENMADGGFLGQPEHFRAGTLFVILSTLAAALAAVCFFVRPAAITAAALFYGLLTITFNYEAVWLSIGNAQRLSIDLFTSLALAFVLTKTAKGWLLPRTFAVFWSLTLLYMLYGTFNAVDVRGAMLSWAGF